MFAATLKADPPQVEPAPPPVASGVTIKAEDNQVVVESDDSVLKAKTIQLQADKKYDYCFSVEEVNKLVLSGISFRDAYQIIANKIKTNDFNPERTINHSHIGSIGN